MSVFFMGQASVAYNNTGMHLDDIKWRNVSSDALRPSLLNRELTARKYLALVALNVHFNEKEETKVIPRYCLNGLSLNMEI
jgi:hypothetical protein